ncbi:MAG TPA: PBP1A family penicillin-binding protein [Rickettsiales bacterium]|nr:PBP1A family penicillin-binding protein [Rickettsiales bacterium]
MKKETLRIYFYIFTSLFIIGVLFLFAIIAYYSKDLPNYKSLRDYNPSLTTRLYSSDGKFLKEYAKEKRLFVPIEQIPDLVKHAFISAEDASFYHHAGVDLKSIVSAIINNVYSKITGKNNLRGGSTITQQVAKNFLLSNEKTLSRKIKEAILSIRMTQAFTKDEILELYLNQIFLGNRAYGVASAALNYFNKSLDQLTIEEAALIASLPKAPAKLDPTRNDNIEIVYRRDWIIDRMFELGYIDKDERDLAKSTPIKLNEKSIEEVSNGEFFSEEVRKELVNLYGEENLLEAGNVVTTTLDPELQKLADEYLKRGIEEYDVRHGFRGPIGDLTGEIDFKNNWGDLINNFKTNLRFRDTCKKAVVLKIDDQNSRILIGLEKVPYNDSHANNIENNPFITTSNDDQLLITGYIPLENLKWAKKYIDIDTMGPEIKKVSDVNLKVGDVILVEENKDIKNEYFFRQIPAINGALLAMDPHTGKVLAMMGGYIDSQMDFNRATQAERQPGSTMKVFAYLTALENGYTPASIIVDEEIELDQGLDRPPYKPKNNEGEGIFFGPTTLRVGLEKSRNVTTVRLASEVGISKVAEMVKRFGVNNRPKKIYSLVLGSTETNLLKMVKAYAMIVNGGKEIQPSLIEKIQDKRGETIFRREDFDCQYCLVDDNTELGEIIIPNIPDVRKSIIDSATAYQITNMLVGVVQRGTGWRAKWIGKPIGAKTGTTNDGKDAWFIGFSPDLVVGVYIGFDIPEYLGLNEYGSNVAGPIFTNFMRNALKDKPSIPFRVPDSVKLVKIDTKTGYYPTPYSDPKDIVLEAFKEGDKIQKFENEISDDEFEYDISEMESGSRSDRPTVITNTPERDEEYIKELDEESYYIDDEENDNNNKTYKVNKTSKEDDYTQQYDEEDNFDYEGKTNTNKNFYQIKNKK